MYTVPILFVIFRRKDAALQSFARIRDAKPARLYIAGDGPRPGVDGEAEQVEQTRKAVMDAIDWPCEVKTLFRDCNIGCGQGVYTAINWFFEHEERGIIIEDDCVLQPSFFPFAEELLERYKDDERIGMIAGTNPLGEVAVTESYLFSKYAACWGWATWRRAWNKMDIGMSFLSSKKEDVIANRGCGNERNRWLYQIGMIAKGRVSAWDWQWYFSLAAQNQLCIFPKANLVSNIGDDEMATHTAFSSIRRDGKHIAFPLVHPEFVMPSVSFDKALHRDGNTTAAWLKRHLPYHLKQQIKKLTHR